MPVSIRILGTDISRPSVITHHNLDGLLNLDLGDSGAVLVIGEAAAGKPMSSFSSPVFHTFTDPQDMIDYFVDGHLAEVARCLFRPAIAGQYETGVEIGGARVVYAIKTNQSTQASYTLKDGSSNNALTLKDRYWGVIGNQNWFKLEVAATTGLKLTIGRDVDPDTGSQESINFSVTGVDEWISVTTTGNFTGASCTYDMGVATAGKITLNSDVALEDLEVTLGTKTIEEVVAEINSFDPHGTGSVYLATVLRSDRANTQASYLDLVTATSCFSPTVAKNMGVSYDIVSWVNTNSFYCEATWVAGYEPQTYTKTYLQGGSLGQTSAISYIQNALQYATRLPVRFVASGYDADVGSGSVTLSSINTEFASHATKCNKPGVPCERQVFITNTDSTKAAMYTAVAAFNNEWLFNINNRIYRDDHTGTKVWLGQHCTACAAAGIMAGSPVATPLTHKFIIASDVDFAATDFDTLEDLDFYNGIKNGLLFLEQVPGTGFRFAKGVTTYTLKDNDGRRYGEVVECRIRHAQILRRAIQELGQKSKGVVTAQGIQRKVLEAHRLMADIKDPDFILVEGTDEDGNIVPAYRNIRTSISGDLVTVRGEVTFTSGINWVFNDFRATLPSAIVG